MKMLIIYDKNGNALEIKESLKTAFVGKGFFLKNPVKAIEAEKTKEVKENG